MSEGRIAEPEVGDGDDDKQVEDQCEQTNAGQSDVSENGHRLRSGSPLTRGVEEIWETEFQPIRK